MTLKAASLLLFACPLFAQETVAVAVKQLDRKLRLPAEILPYQAVDLHARVSGFVETVSVDRGSAVRKGQLLIELSAPELKAQLLEIEAKAQATESLRAEADAKLASAEASLKRLTEAAATAGAVAGLEVIQAQKAVDALRSQIASIQSQAKATRATAASVQEMMAYLKITAPFDGTITARHVHPGALATGPLLRLEQLSRLRVVVSVPESEVATMVRGAVVSFMLAGMLPIALGAEQTAPLGRAVFGGLLLGTIGTLTFVPLFYSILQPKNARPASLLPHDFESR